MERTVTKTFTRVRDAGVGGALTRDETWGDETRVVDHLFVPRGITLTMEPGTVFRLKHYRGYKEPRKGLGIVIEGTLRAGLGP